MRSTLAWRPRLKIYKSDSGKVTFDPKKMEGRSYGHWLFFREIKTPNNQTINVFNEYDYSITTRGHQSALRSLLRQLNIHVHLFVSDYSSLDGETHSTIIDELETAYECYFESIYKTMRPRLRAKTISDLKSTAVNCLNRINQLEILGYKLTQKRIKELDDTALQLELDYWIKTEKKPASEKTNLEIAQSELKAIATEKLNDLNSLTDVFTDFNALDAVEL